MNGSYPSGPPRAWASFCSLTPERLIPCQLAEHSLAVRIISPLYSRHVGDHAEDACLARTPSSLSLRAIRQITLYSKPGAPSYLGGLGKQLEDRPHACCRPLQASTNQSIAICTSDFPPTNRFPIRGRRYCRHEGTASTRQISHQLTGIPAAPTEEHTQTCKHLLASCKLRQSNGHNLITSSGSRNRAPCGHAAFPVESLPTCFCTPNRV